MNLYNKKTNPYIKLSKEIQEFIRGRFGVKSIIVFDLREVAKHEISVCMGLGWFDVKNLDNLNNIVDKHFKGNKLISQMYFSATSQCNSDETFVVTPEGNVFQNSYKFPFPNFTKLNFG